MPVNWEALNRNIGSLGTVLAQQAMQRRQRQQELSDAITLAILEAQIKQQYTPREWKPTTKEEALEFEKVKRKPFKPYKPFEITEKKLGKLEEKARGAAETKFPISPFSPFGKIAAILTPGRTQMEALQQTQRGQQQAEFERRMSPFYHRFGQQFLPQQVLPQQQLSEEEINTLIEEYNTTNDQTRARDIEDILIQQGVEFE